MVTPLCNFSPWVWTGPSACLIIYRIWQRLWDITSEMRLQRSCSFHLALLLLQASSEGSQLPCFECLYGKVHEARNQSRSLATVREQQVLTIIVQVNLRADPPPAEPWDETAAPADKHWLQLWETPWGRDTQVSHTRIPGSREWEIIDVCSFKLLTFSIISYIAIDN